jgi:hypothetical protein
MHLNSCHFALEKRQEGAKYNAESVAVTCEPVTKNQTTVQRTRNKAREL